MFDKIIQGPGGDHRHTHDHKVTVNRAPTDESVRLLKEFREETLLSVLGGVRVSDTAIDCIVIAIEADNPLLDRRLFVRFCINEDEKLIEITVPYKVLRDIPLDSFHYPELREMPLAHLPEVLAETIKKLLAEAVVEVIMQTPQKQ